MFQREFFRRLFAEPAFEGAKLDIGCGVDFPRAFDQVRDNMGIVDGVDPFPDVSKHPCLRNHWHGKFEEADIPTDSYDLAYAYNVVEHIDQAKPFFKTLRRVLRPGGAFWALTPHGKHPFASCVRLVQWAQLKTIAAKRDEAERLRTGDIHEGVNDYPAYYRLNKVNDIAAAAGEAGFSKLEMLYMPCMQWDRYFPKPLRFIPHLHDRFRGLTKKNAALVIAYRLE